jgi:hypothetical protein
MSDHGQPPHAQFFDEEEFFLFSSEEDELDFNDFMRRSGFEESDFEDDEFDFDEWMHTGK